MTWDHAILLGILQGLTEFLPVSSSGHLVIVLKWLGYDPESPQMLAFNVICHVGTLLAICVVFRREFARLITYPRISRRILLLAALATVVTALIGLPLKDRFQAVFGSPQRVACAFIVTGALIWITERLPRPRGGWKKFGWLAAAGVGIGQAAAITPGISRSGITICFAMLFGLRRRWAAEFSFLIAVPAIVGATVFEIRDLSKADVAVIDAQLGAFIVGGLMAAVSGYFALRILLRMLKHSHLHWFSYYLWALGAFLLLTA